MPSLAAYLCLLFSLFVAFSQALPIPPTLSTQNITIAFNSSQVRYSPKNWEVISALPSESSQPFTFSNVIGASFGLVLPNGTVAVDYIGVPRSAGAAYAVCIDCDLVDETKGFWALVDGNQPDLVNDDQATPTVFFSVVALDPTVPHTMTVTNIPDTRFDNTSQITFHSLNVTMADNNGAGNLESSTGTAKPTETSDTTNSTDSSSAPPAEPTSETPSHSETSTSGTATSSDSEPTESPTDSESDSESTSSSAPQAEHDKVPPTVAAPSPSANVNNGSNGAADSTAATKTQKVSKSVIAVIVVLCVLALFCLATALILTYRTRRKRAAARIHDAESQAYGNSQWLTSNVAPVAGMQEVPLSGPPPRPRNPFEDQFPPNVPLELETPGDSTLMNKRAVQRPRSSFGSGMYDRYDRPALR
jgi:hypothetical protein